MMFLISYLNILLDVHNANLVQLDYNHPTKEYNKPWLC